MSREIQFVQSVIRDWRQHPDELAFFESVMTAGLQIDWSSKVLAERMPRDVGPEIVSGVLICGALCSWRKTMGIYTIDDELFAALQDSDPPDAMPPPPEMAAFVFVDGQAFLVFNLWDCSNPMDNAPQAFSQLRGDDGGLIPPWLAWRCLPDGERKATDETFELIEPAALLKLAKIFAYLATKAPDVEGPARPRVLRRNKQGEVVAQNHPVAWQVGVKIGARIRQQRADASLGGTVRPHVRRGHFHTYLQGKGRQERAVKWTAPTFVLGGPDRPAVKSVAAGHGGQP